VLTITGLATIAALLGSYYGASYYDYPTEKGLFKSLDGGVNWNPLPVGWCVDLSLVPF